MNKKKAVFTSLAVLALATVTQTSFAEEVVTLSATPSSWVAGHGSGGVIHYATRMVLTDSTTGNVLYDGSPETMTGWSDLLARLGLSTDLEVISQGVSSSADGATIHVASVALPKAEETGTDTSETSSTVGHTLSNGLGGLADSVVLRDVEDNIIYDGPRGEATTVEEVLSSLGLPTDVQITIAGVRSSLAQGSTFVATLVFSEGATVPTTTGTDTGTTTETNSTDKILAPAGGAAAAQAEDAKSTVQTSTRAAATSQSSSQSSSKAGKSLPNTGDAGSVLTLLGLGLALLGLVGRKRCKG